MVQPKPHYCPDGIGFTALDLERQLGCLGFVDYLGPCGEKVLPYAGGHLVPWDEVVRTHGPGS